MKDIFKIMMTGLTGIFSSLYAGVGSIRLSVMQTVCNNITDIGESVSVIIAVLIAVITLIGAFYKTKSIIRNYKEGK